MSNVFSVLMIEKMVKASGIILAILNLAMFVSIVLLIYKSNTILSIFEIPHETHFIENTDETENIEGFNSSFSYKYLSMTPRHVKSRNMIQSLGFF